MGNSLYSRSKTTMTWTPMYRTLSASQAPDGSLAGEFLTMAPFHLDV